MQHLLRQNLYIIGIVAISIGVIQILGLVASMAMFCCLRQDKYYEEWASRRPWWLTTKQSSSSVVLDRDRRVRDKVAVTIVYMLVKSMSTLAFNTVLLPRLPSVQNHQDLKVFTDFSVFLHVIIYL